MDWIKFLKKNKIDYVEKGPSTAKGNVYVKCVFCGEADQGFHLGISLSNKGWGCWKNTSHRGISPVKLVQRLLKCSWEDAKLIADSQNQALLLPSGMLLKEVSALLGPKQNVEVNNSLSFPQNFKLIRDKAACAPFLHYLESRLYSRKEALQLCVNYQLHYSTHDLFSYRVIVPVFEKQGLVTFTGRHVGSVIPKYKTLSHSLENSKVTGLPQALLPITDCLLNFDKFQRDEKVLLICEGPFDALRLDYFGEPSGIRATCLFGKTISAAQINKLSQIRGQFEECFLLLDRGTEMDAVALIQKLAWLEIKTSQLPQPWKDPGEMEKKAVLHYFSLLLSK